MITENERQRIREHGNARDKCLLDTLEAAEADRRELLRDLHDACNAHQVTIGELEVAEAKDRVHFRALKNIESERDALAATGEEMRDRLAKANIILSDYFFSREVPPKPENKETAQQNEIQEPIKPKPPQEKQLTLSELTQGFLDHLKQQKEPYTMATQSNKQGAPSAEQLMYERYLQKIIQCIVKSYQTCTSKPSNSTQPQEGIIRLSIKRDGSINALYVVESSGNRSVDAFALSLFRDASSSFPPAPERLQGNHHTVDFIFSDLRMFGSIMGWGLRSK